MRNWFLPGGKGALLGVGSRAILIGWAVLAVGAQAAEAASKPDLVVDDPSVSTASAELGEEITLSDTTRNRGGGKAAPSKTRYYLSHDDVRDPADFALPEARSVPRLAARGSDTGNLSTHLPLSAPAGSHYLLACADATRRVDEASERNNCRTSSDPLELTAPPSSHELIDQAEADADITHDQAVTYKVFAEFGDPRLPAEFEVGGPPAGESGALDLAREEWPSLSQPTRDVLDPFFLPAFYEASWANLDGTAKRSAGVTSRAATVHPGQGVCTATQEISDVWGLVKTRNRKLTVWYQESYAGGRAKAVQMAEALNDTIWPKLTGLFRRPLADAGGTGPNCQGPDSTVDVVLAPQLTDARGLATEIGACHAGNTPGYFQVLRDLSGKQLLATTAHELMHVIGFSYPSVQGCSSRELGWLHEATGKWSEDYVYPRANLEHNYAKHLINFPRLPLETVNEDLHQYGAYLFPFYLSRRYSPELVAASWGHLDQSRPLGAIDEALGDNGGSLDEEWHEFARYNWNRAPVDKYKKWDGLRDTPMPENSQSVFSAGSYDWTLSPVEHLAAAYNLYEFGTVNSVGHVKFTNPYADTAYTKVQAIVELADGTREIQDWSEEEKISFCREDPAEEINFLTLIVSHSDWGFGSDASAGTLGATARKECFPKTFTGTASGTQSSGGLTETWTATYELERIAQDGDGATWRAGGLGGEGTFQWKLAGTAGDCTYEGEAALELAGELSIWESPEPAGYELELWPSTVTVPVTRACTGESPQQVFYQPLNMTFYACNSGIEAYAGESTLGGARATSGVDPTVTCTWNMSASP